MKPMDRILKQLQDTQWHSLDEIKKSVSLPSQTLNAIICFLQEQAFINKEDEKLRITRLGLRYLDI
ncbi:MAG: hypothetical protein FIB08_08755 [Candidatus Methanoperedens sp.]|nr:hypothetical protein [Candidatus Methanoperedens sp.]